MNRKEFIQRSAPALLLIGAGQWVFGNEALINSPDRRKRIARFVVASDGHYGQPNTNYVEYFNTFINRVNEEHASDKFDFAVINGDLFHDDKKYLPEVKMKLDGLHPTYYVSQGNHDNCTKEEWEKTWNMPLNFSFTKKNCAYIVASTSNEKGTYLCPDLTWMETELEKHKKAAHIFIFIHINPGKLTRHAVDCPGFFTLLKKYPAVRCVFNGHDHDEEGIKNRDGVSFIFDAHFGGNWGTAYRGFRIVELYQDGNLLTYIMDPGKKINELSLSPLQKTNQ